MFFRTNQQDLSRLTDVQLLVSQKIGSTDICLKTGGSWVNNWFQQPDRKTFYGFRTGDNQLLMSYGGKPPHQTISGFKWSKLFLWHWQEYQVNLGKKQEDNYYPVTISAGYNGFADSRTMSYRFIYSTTTGVQEIINIDSPDSSFATANANGNFQWQESAQPNSQSFPL